MLPFLVHVEPVELATHGFREELTIRLLDDVLEVIIPLGYSDPRGEKALSSFKRMGITLRDESGLVVAHVPLSSLSSSDLGAVQEQIVEIRDTFQAAVNQA